MYGFGSKKALLEDFASTSLTECGVVVINGYLQSINIKQVLLFRFNYRAVYVSLAPGYKCSCNETSLESILAECNAHAKVI